MQLWPSGLRRRIQDPLSMMRGFEPHWLQKLNINKNKKNDSCKRLIKGIITAIQTKIMNIRPRRFSQLGGLKGTMTATHISDNSE